MVDDVRSGVDDLDHWLTTAAVAESTDEQRAVIRATLQRVREGLRQQVEELARLRTDNARRRQESSSMREESQALRTESARLRAERNAAHEEIGQLRTALSSRVIIEQAKGMVAARRGIGVDQAFQRIRRHSRDNNARIHDVAEQVVNEGLEV